MTNHVKFMQQTISPLSEGDSSVCNWYPLQSTYLINCPTAPGGLRELLWTPEKIRFQFCLKCSQWHVFTQGWWQTVPHCRTAVREAPLFSRGLNSRQYNAASWRWPQSWATVDILHWTMSSRRYVGATPLTHFHAITADLKVTRRRTGSRWRLCSIGETRSRSRAPDTRRAGAFWTAWSRFICPSAAPVSIALQ